MIIRPSSFLFTCFLFVCFIWERVPPYSPGWPGSRKPEAISCLCLLSTTITDVSPHLPFHSVSAVSPRGPCFQGSDRGDGVSGRLWSVWVSQSCSQHLGLAEEQLPGSLRVCWVRSPSGLLWCRAGRQKSLKFLCIFSAGTIHPRSIFSDILFRV